MTPTVINYPQNIGRVIQDNAGGKGPFIGVYVNYDGSNCHITATLEVGNRTYNYYSGTYVQVFCNDTLLFNMDGNKIYPGSQRIVLAEAHDFHLTGHCGIWARFNQAFGSTNGYRWNFSTTPIYFDASIIPSMPDTSWTWGDDTFIKNDSTNNYETYRLYQNDEYGKKNTLHVSRSADNAVLIRTRLYKDDNLIAFYDSDFDLTFNEEDRGHFFYMYSTAESSTGNDVDGWTSHFWINDIPTIKEKDISINSLQPINDVSLKWGSDFYDKLNADNVKKYRIVIRKFTPDKKGSKTGTFGPESFIDVANINNVNFKLSDYNINKGEQAYVSIRPGDYLEHNYNEQGCFYVTRNSIPYFTKGSKISSNIENSTYNYVFKDKISLSWNNAYDNENDKISYKLYYSHYENNKWSDWDFITSTVDTNITLNCQNYVDKGQKIRFGIIANDGLEDSLIDSTKVSIVSEIFTRDIEPAPPTICTVFPTNETHYETIQKVEWTLVKCINGKICDSYKVELWGSRDKSFSTAFKISEKRAIGSSTTYDISSINRGVYFFFKVYAIDMYELMSLTAINSKWCRRNQRPNQVRNFRVNSNKFNFYKTVPLIWDASSDPDDDNITYSIYFSLNGNSSYNLIASGLTSTTYTHNISNLNPKDKLNYKIVCIDKFGISSPETQINNAGKIVVNTKPAQPQLIYPSGAMYNKNPRLLIQTKGDDDNDELMIRIIVNGQEYNSALSSNFSKTSYEPKNDKIIFVCPDLKIGQNNIDIIANDGYQDSVKKSYSITYLSPLRHQLSQNEDLYISTEVYDDLLKMINQTRISYGHKTIASCNPIKNQTIITSNIYGNLYNGIKEINTWINTNYPGKNREKINPIINNNVIISKKIFNSILDVITIL